MKRLHVNLAVSNLDRSIDFYSTLFGAAPSVVKSDYAKWMLDDPRVNFAITARGHAPGVDHLGIQVETEAELAEVQRRLNAADGPVRDQGAVTCCYAQSEKSWITDPQGVSWEAFLTSGASETFGDETEKPVAAPCCAPAAAAVRCCD